MEECRIGVVFNKEDPEEGPSGRPREEEEPDQLDQPKASKSSGRQAAPRASGVENRGRVTL